MSFLPTMSTIKTAAWAIVLLAAANRIPQARNLIQGS